MRWIVYFFKESLLVSQWYPKSYTFCGYFLSGNHTVLLSIEVMPKPTTWVATVIPKLLKVQVQINQAEIKDAIYMGMSHSNWILKP